MTGNKRIDDITLLEFKLEAAKELGLLDKVRNVGWSGLTSEESGKLGGYVSKKIRSKKEKQDT